jgi:uncharacterized protein YciI
VSVQEPDWIERFVLLYESPPAGRARAPEFFAAHSAYADEFRARHPGVLLLIGPFPQMEEGHPGAMAILTSRDAAEEFAVSDPFVVNEVVTKWYIRAWLVS